MVFLVMARSAENIEKKNKKDRRKTLKNEKLLYKKIYFAQKHSSVVVSDMERGGETGLRHHHTS